MINANELRNKTLPIDMLEKEIDKKLSKVKMGRTYISVNTKGYTEEQIKYAEEKAEEAGLEVLRYSEDEIDHMKISWGVSSNTDEEEE